MTCPAEPGREHFFGAPCLFIYTPENAAETRETIARPSKALAELAGGFDALVEAAPRRAAPCPVTLRQKRLGA